MKYRWLFTVEDEEECSIRLGPDGTEKDGDIEFVGTQNEAFAEADRRAGLYEEKNGGFLLKVECERRGPTVNEMSGKAGPGGQLGPADLVCGPEKPGPAAELRAGFGKDALVSRDSETLEEKLRRQSEILSRELESMIEYLDTLTGSLQAECGRLEQKIDMLYSRVSKLEKAHENKCCN